MPARSPLITIATVCFNPIKNGRIKAFQICIDSIKLQSYPNIEHLIIDGASNDGSVDFIRKNAETNKKIRFISEKDRGIYDAMNKAIRQARGEYIVFINTDDAFSDNESVESMVSACLKDDGDFLYADADVYNTDHSQLQYTWHSTINEMPYGYYPCHQTLMAKTSILRELGGFTEKYMANDNLLILKLVARNYKPVYLGRVVVDFHLGGASQDMINAKEKMKQEHVEFFYEEIGRKCKLTKEDCSLLYEHAYLNSPPEKIVELGLKLNNEYWRTHYFTSYIQHLKTYYSGIIQSQSPAYKNVKIRLFGGIPLFSIRIQGDY